ncbi:hypothetical protein [Mycoplasmopsis cricetuli]|uniref:hypothetical protein n=1 Tax=Mycoplasmopsis cricetuli TaxID=171283 RepID=UPI00046E9542|nr:hypothetical protein [Mycoplasmopsis cricetuli]
MKKFISTLNSKITEDKRKLRRVLFFDKFFSVLILFLNLSLLGIAITALVKLINLIKSNKDHKVEISQVILIVLVVFIILSFVLTLIIAIYKANTQYQRYRKIRNTAIDLGIKYKHKIITKEEFTNYLKVLLIQLSKKEKIKLTTVLKKQLTRGKNA